MELISDKEMHKFFRRERERERTLRTLLCDIRDNQLLFLTMLESSLRPLEFLFDVQHSVLND